MTGQKELSIYRLPPVLILQFKRFKQEGTISKDQQKIIFPLENLDMGPYVHKGGSEMYDLFGVSNHMGTMSFGHYTAFAKNGGTWWEYNDSIVKEVPREEVVTEGAYVLFY